MKKDKCKFISQNKKKKKKTVPHCGNFSIISKLAPTPPISVQY